LGVGDAIPEHEAAHPNNEADDREFPQVNQRDGKKLDGADQLQNAAFGPVLKEFEGRRFIFNEFLLYIEKQEAGQTKQKKGGFFLCDEQ
jgi:hypothetical protein